MPDQTFAEKHGLAGKGNLVVDKEREALAEEIETRVASETRMNRGNTGEPLTTMSCDINKICRIVLDSIYDLDEGKGSTPRDISLQTGFSLHTIMDVIKYEKHKIQSQWCSHDASTRYKVIE